MRSAPHSPAPHSPAPDLHAYDLIVICSSAGKDSMALLAHVAELIQAQEFRGRVVVLHNDLGVTRSGQPVEWPGVLTAVREHAARYGFEVVVRRRTRGGLWDQLLGERGLWMSAGARWCTSDQKEGQAMTWVTEAVTELRDLLEETGRFVDRPVQVLYALGLRGQESDSRAAQEILAVNERRSSGNRVITRWLPLRDWTIADVWAQIKRAGLRPHAGYSWGLSRLSCSLCVLASIDDLLLAAALRPDLAADYAWAEQRLGHRFTAALSMAEILAGLDVARREACADPAAGHAEQALWQLVWDHIASTPAARGQGATAKGRPRTPWPAAKISERASRHTTKILTSARRAIALAARANTSLTLADPLDDVTEALLVAMAESRPTR